MVIIGQNLDEGLIRAALDDALLTDNEWAQWEEVQYDGCLRVETHQYYRS